MYFLGAGMFFVFGSRAVDQDRWFLYFIEISTQLGYTAILIVAIRAAYKGPQLWKVVSRTSSVFMIINILAGICTLGFIY